MKLNRLVANLVLAGVCMLGAVACESGQNVTPAQKTQIEEVVRNYLLQNPEVIVQAVQNLQQKQMDQARKSIQKTQDIVAKYVSQLFGVTADPMIGNPNGKVTIVEFFDYQCPHCVAMTPVMDSLIKSNKDVKVVFKEFPIRGPVSELAARLALAANMQGKYFEFHKAVMAASQGLTEEGLYNIAKSVGLNVDKLKTDSNSDAVKAQLKQNIQLAQDLALLGTPAFFVAKSSITKESNPASSAVAFIPGQIDQEQLSKVVDKAAQG